MIVAILVLGIFGTLSPVMRESNQSSIVAANSPHTSQEYSVMKPKDLIIGNSFPSLYHTSFAHLTTPDKRTYQHKLIPYQPFKWALTLCTTYEYDIPEILNYVDVTFSINDINLDDMVLMATRDIDDGYCATWMTLITFISTCH